VALAVAKRLDDIQLSVISKFFSSAVIKELAQKGHSPLFARLVHESNLLNKAYSIEPIKDLFEEAFNLFKKRGYIGYRQEYIYKSAITKNILLGRHSLNTASMINEFRVGERKADAVILSGTSTAYEVKSDLDTLARLENQILEYRKVFASVYVVAGESYLEAVCKIVPDDVGIMGLNRNYNISVERKAIDLPERTNPIDIFESIQLHESKMILQQMGIKTPDVPNTRMYDELRGIFEELDSISTHKGMVDVLKKTRSLSGISKYEPEIPNSLKAAVFSSSLRKKDYKRLIEVLNTPICEALNWSV
jgi:hypothetical protein